MKRYPCIGGPLNGQFASSEELREERRAQRSFGRWAEGDVITPGGIYGEHARDYAAYNRADSHHSYAPTMVWLHRSLLEAP